MWETEFVKALHQQFEARRQHFPNYSIRKYAKEIGLSAAALSELMRGQQKWKLSSERAIQIVERLNLSEVESNRILGILGHPIHHVRQKIKIEDHEFLSNPLLIPILVCHDLVSLSEREPQQIADRLQIPVDTVLNAIRKLLYLGYLHHNPTSGHLERNPNFLAAGDGPPSQTIAAYHRENLKRAARALSETPADQRDFTSVTFAGSLRKLPLIREEIRSFHERISKLMEEQSQNDEVIQIMVSLFPIHYQEQPEPPPPV